MLLDDLIEVIETLKGRIADHGPTLSVSETRTRVALIDPLLQVLGWDTTDPSIVVQEYDVNGRKADYVLLCQNSLPAATLEAKKLGEPLESHLKQMICNANRVGVKFAGISDGDQWELYEVLPHDALDEGRILSLRISATPPNLCALKLLHLWRPNLASGQVESAGEPVAAPSSEVDPVTPVSKAIDWVPLSKFVAKKKSNRPELIRFPDGSEHRLQAWYDLVLQTVAWLCSKGILESGDTTEFSTVERHWLHTKAVHPSGKPFFNPKPIAGTDLIVETNLNRFESTRRAKVLMSRCGQDLSRVHLGDERK